MITRDNMHATETYVATLAFDHYDKGRAAQIARLEWLARFLPEERNLETEGYPETFPAEWTQVYPRWREWIGPRQAQGAGTEKLFLEKKNIELTTTFEMDSLSSPRIRQILTDYSMRALEDYPRGLFARCADLIEQNPVVYDNQSLFDTEHRKPDGSPASNLVDAGGRAAFDNPTEEEMRGELDESKKRLIENSLFQTDYYVDDEFPELRILVRNTFDARMLERINRKDWVSDSRTEMNPWKGKLTLIQRVAKGAPMMSYDVLWPTPGGPRPVVLVEAKGPKAMRFDPNVSLDDWNKEIDYGTEAKIYIGPGMWQGSCRVDYGSLGG